MAHHGSVVESVDTTDLKSVGGYTLWGFKSPRSYSSQSDNRPLKPPMAPDLEYTSLMSKTTTQLSVSTRRGIITFTSDLEWNEAIALCQEESRKGNKFAFDLCMRETKGLVMSESQVSWVYKIAEDVRKLRDEPKNPVRQVRSIDASNILASLAEARAKGIKKPMLRLLMPRDCHIKVKYMSLGKNAGGCWVTSNDNLIGKIDDGGVFTFTGKPYTENFICEVFEFIESINSDVKGALESYGKITSKCGCCGLPLTNKKSIELGIGPICLDKYGLLSFA